MKVEDQKVVGIDYTLFLEDGSIADSTEGEEPLYFLYGNGNIIPGLEKALEGLAVGAEKTVEIEADDAYGGFDENAFEEMPLSAFPEDLKLEKGIPFALLDEEGNHIPAIVHEVGKETVTMDLNHPLAGQKLKFQVKVVDIREASQEELSHGHVHGPEGHGHHH
jgi:FKBP-type peptidyl-prolyl cis-trans isomerase SlyD